MKNGALAFSAASLNRKTMLLFATYCSANKEVGTDDMPAVKRYISDRITGVHAMATAAEARFAILSGQFGLLEAHDPIPYYDHLLHPSELDGMTQRVATTLKEWGISEIRWFSVAFEMDPNVTRYRDVMLRAATQVDAAFDLDLWSPAGTSGLV